MAAALNNNSQLYQYKQSRRRSLDILYITGRKEYPDDGKLTQDHCTEEQLWQEFITKKSIQNVLISWRKRSSKLDNNQNDESILREISSFRMVLHRTHRMKMSYNANKSKYDSKCQYFVMLWIPCNSENGLNKYEYDQLISAFNKELYFCNKLNKQCIYISGPKYGDDQKDDRAKTPFHLSSLYKECEKLALPEVSEVTDTHQLNIEIVVHEFDRKEIVRDHKDFKPDILSNVPGQLRNWMKPGRASISGGNRETIRNYKRGKSNHTAVNTQESIQLTVQDSNSGIAPRRIMTRIMPSSSSNDGETELPAAESVKSLNSAPDELDIEHRTTAREEHAFAFIWFKIKCESPSNAKEKDSNLPVIEEEEEDDDSKDDRNSQSKPALKHSDHNDSGEMKMQKEEEKQKAAQMPQKEENQDHIGGVLAALNVFDRLHDQQCEKSKYMINVELMGVDNYYNNLSLGVDTYHNGSWKRGKYMLAFLVLIQCLFLPIFVLLPPNDIINCCGVMRCCCKNYRPKPRYRPQGTSSDAWQDLDITELIPYDISAIWRTITTSKILGFIFSTVLMVIVYGGPYLYPYKSSNVEDLSFFDCYGPAIFYGLGVVTIICWACLFRGLIAPKEHLLLYNKMIAQRPKNTKKPATDFDTLTHLSEPQAMTIFSYALRKSFLEVRTPKHNVLSRRSLKCCCTTQGKYNDAEWEEERCRRFKAWFILVAVVMVYFCMQNLEDFQSAHRPFYIDPHHVKHYILRQVYGIVSNITSCILLVTFIILWETMFSRIKRQCNNVNHITNLLISNTYSEYITFDVTDNILSWIQLGDFIKRKGMMLFASLETPVFSLFCMCILSWGCTIYCIFEGTGLELVTDQSIFSNSALATWFYLALFGAIQIGRLLYYGYRFNQESEKQENAIKTQCSTIGNENLMQFLKHDKLSIEQKYAIQSAQTLLTSLKDHSEIVPEVFGIQFDKLTSKVVMSGVLSAIPTVFGYVIGRVKS